MFWWGPLWAYVCTVATGVLSEDQESNGFFNGGQYVKADQAREIARRLDRVLRNGEVKRLVKRRRGRRFDEQLVRDFKNFCRNCGGFYIW
jgi:hypothetical protein